MAKYAASSIDQTPLSKASAKLLLFFETTKLFAKKNTKKVFFTVYGATFPILL
ncbi:MAG: hypothetical protein ACI4BD_01800 [Paludibacteraceae bacterium]